MELADYLRLLLRSWALLLVSALIGLALATCYLLTQPVLYAATSATFISTSSAPDVSSAAAGATFAQGAAANLAEIADKPYVLDVVRRTLKLNTSADELSREVHGQVVPDSSVVQVTVTTTDPQLSAAMANAVTAALSSTIERLIPNVGNAASVGRATTIQRAVPPSTPVSPSVSFDLGIGLLGGFAVAVLLVLIRQSVDQRLRSIEQLVRVARAPVIGVVPVTPPAAEGADVVLEPDRVGRFRAVRSEVLEGAVETRVIVVSGTKRGESTAAVAASIAASVANAGLTTLVLDAVSASAPAAPIFDARPEVGLTEALDRTRTTDQLLVAGPVTNLWYLPPGRPSRQREDLVASVEMTDVLEALISRFKVIIINTDAVEDSPIARTLGRQADGVVLTCELNRSSVSEVRRAAESLERGGVRLIGTVVLSPEQKVRRRRADRSTLRHAAVAEA